MVKLNIIVEGGAYANNVSAETANNAESLRQSLHKFFTRILKQEEIDIVIFMGKGYRNAARQFIESSIPLSLFVDSDYPPETKLKWFQKLINEENPEKTIVIPEDKIRYVFFMIQEMEAWFLKQIHCLNRWAEIEGYTRKDPQMNLADHSTIKNKNIEAISKPSEKLNLIMRRFFYKDKKAAKYGKLKTSPLLLDLLDVSILIPMDSELQRFLSTVNSTN